MGVVKAPLGLRSAGTCIFGLESKRKCQLEKQVVQHNNHFECDDTIVVVMQMCVCECSGVGTVMCKWNWMHSMYITSKPARVRKRPLQPEQQGSVIQWGNCVPL